jgi:hypothetical protein
MLEIKAIGESTWSAMDAMRRTVLLVVFKRRTFHKSWGGCGGFAKGKSEVARLEGDAFLFGELARIKFWAGHPWTVALAWYPGVHAFTRLQASTFLKPSCSRLFDAPRRIPSLHDGKVRSEN